LSLGVTRRGRGTTGAFRPRDILPAAGEQQVPGD
jgi:hypothetical protein